VAALQNAYSLACRTFDVSGLAEACHLERVGLLAYSPLAMGWLTVRVIFGFGFSGQRGSLTVATHP
jgi:aryl-alcohol dehydrogenase-like predicted oxidoreductase